MVKNIRGMSLVSVMIAAALSILVGLGMAAMLNNSNKGVKGVRSRGEYEDLKALVRMMSHEQEKCEGAFRGDSGELPYVGAPLDFKRLQIEGTDVIAVQDAGTTSGGLRVTRLQLLPFAGPGSGVAAEGSHAVRLQIDAEVVGESFGPRSFSESVPMRIRTSATGAIESCDGQTVENPVPQLCESLGLTFNPDTQNCGVPVTPQLCDFENGEVVAGIEPNGKIVCQVPTITVPPEGGGGSCVGWVNRKCWGLDKSVDGGRGWRVAANNNPVTNYCSDQTARCAAQGGQVSDIDAGGAKNKFEYCSDRWGTGSNVKPASKRGTCKTWEERQTTVRQHSCICN